MTTLAQFEQFNQQNVQTLGTAVIEISNLRLRTFIGFNEEEMKKQQDVVINAEIKYPLPSACQSDHVDSALNYKTITKQIINYVSSKPCFSGCKGELK